MDVGEKLVELSDIQVLQREMECVKRKSATNCTDCLNCDLLMTDERILTAYKNAIDALRNAHGITAQELDGCEYCNAFTEEDINGFFLPTTDPDCECAMVTIKFCPMCGRRLPQPPKGE